MREEEGKDEVEQNECPHGRDWIYGEGGQWIGFIDS